MPFRNSSACACAAIVAKRFYVCDYHSLCGIQLQSCGGVVTGKLFVAVDWQMASQVADFKALLDIVRFCSMPLSLCNMRAS
jgi:hypothetical protein